MCAAREEDRPLTRHGTAVVTIVGSNYLARASVLRDSLRRWQPDWDVVTVVVDVADTDDLLAADVGEVRTPEDLGIGERDLTMMGFLYNITEFCTAIKPATLLHLLDQGYENVLYIDPDTRLFHPMTEVLELLNRHDVVLTPHSLAPIPDDGLDPTHDNIRSCGSFNLGFFAGTAGSRPLLEWWNRVLLLGAGMEIELNRFTDQRWMDLAPSYADVAVLRHRGYNVAYWNLHERTLSGRTDDYKVDEEPLVHFHFSGYEPAVPWRLSKYIARPRVRIADSTVLRELCDAYRVDLEAWSAAPEHAALESRHYRRGQLPLLSSPGTHTRSVLRTMMREEQLQGLDPLRATSHRDTQHALQDWLLTPPADAPRSGVPRILWATWQSRADLRMTYPHPHGLSRAALLAWADELGPAQEGLPADLPLLVRQNEQERAGVRPAAGGEAPEGLTVVGLLESRSDLGDAGRRLADLLSRRSLGGRSVVARLPDTDSQPGLHLDEPGELGDVTVWCLDAPHLGAARDSLPAIAASSRLDVVYWWGEADVPDATGRIDEVWAPSRFVQENLSLPRGTTIELAPLVLDADPTFSSLARTDVGLPESGTVFLVRLNFLDSLARQNVPAVVEAFRSAFPEPADAFLLIRTVHGQDRADALDQLAWSVRDRVDIRVWDGILPPEDDRALTRASDCFVSLHRAVGLGPHIAEAMALGRSTIATAYSGNLDYCTAATTHLVPFRTVRVSDPSGAYAADGTWAEPDVAAAARAMASVAGNPAGAARMSSAARERIAELSDPDAFAEFARKRLDALRQRPSRPDDPRVRDSVGATDVEAVDQLTTARDPMPVNLPPVESVLGYGRRDAGPVRRVVRRVMFSLTKNNLYYSRNLVAAALEQIGVATSPEYRVVTTTRDGARDN
jgi:glycosyltransferase involved in cell wall biosynthesis